MEELMFIALFFTIFFFPGWCWINYERKNSKLRYRIITGVIAIFSAIFIALCLKEISNIPSYYATDFKNNELKKVVHILKEELNKNTNPQKRKALIVQSLDEFSNKINSGDVRKDIKILREFNDELIIKFTKLDEIKDEKINKKKGSSN